MHRTSQWHAAVALCGLAGCDPTGVSSPDLTTTDLRASSLQQRHVCTHSALRARLQKRLAEARAQSPENTGYLLAARVEPLHFSEELSIGPVSPRATFRIASVTKTFTAAAILRLVEQGRLCLHDRVVDVVPEPYPELLRSDGYNPEEITVFHLLTHTSGLFDYAYGSEDYARAVQADISRDWTREDQVRFAMEHGDPIAPAGEVYEYSDTGYVLLGAILENRTGKNLGDALASELRFDRLRMKSTWLETVQAEPRHAPDRAPQTYEGIQVADINASVDLWGGGGLVSTASELARFYEALLGGDVFDRDRTLAMMQTVPPPNEASAAAMGLYRVDLAPGVSCWGHDGLWNVVALSCPSLGISMAILGVDTPQSDAGLDLLLATAMQEAVACVPAASAGSSEPSL